jgi:hypothetical protein
MEASTPPETTATELHPIISRFVTYVKQRCSDPAGTDLMCNFYFTNMEQELNSDGDARELAAGLLMSAQVILFQSLSLWHKATGCTPERKKHILRCIRQSRRVLRYHTHLPVETLRKVTWGQTRLRLLARWQLDGVAALALIALDAYEGPGSDGVIIDYFIKNVVIHRRTEWAGRELDDHSARLQLKVDVTGGSATAIGAGVHSLAIEYEMVMTGDTTRSETELTANMSFSAHQGVRPERGNAEAHAVGTALAETFCTEHVREIRSGQYRDRLAVDHPTWPYGFYVDENHQLHRLNDAGGTPVRLSSFEVSPVGFEQPGASTGFGRSSELAHFLASVLLTLEAHVPSAATGGLELVGATIKVIPVEGVTVKVSAASHAGLPLVLTPGANEVPADCEGTTVLQVATALDAVFAVCDHAAGC